jgi:hypothetical protein
MADERADGPEAVAGRVCPLDYRTDPGDLARAPEVVAETLYVAGGLYGNPFALDIIEGMAAAERAPVTLVFNGDAHWFDAEAGLFAALDARLAAYPAIRGNVEAELARALDAGAGCGCAYPPDVDDAVVARSNAILERLKTVAGPQARTRFQALPTTMVASVGGSRIGIVHGDPTSLAGWGFSEVKLRGKRSRPWLDRIRMRSGIDIFASSHTCGAVLRAFDLPSGRMIVANNGAAGMGNGPGYTAGLLTRIALTPSPHPPRASRRSNGVFVDAIPIPFDAQAFLRLFDRIWPQGSPAAVSYRARIAGGAQMSVAAQTPDIAVRM